MHDRDRRDRSRTIEKTYRDDLPLMQASREPVVCASIYRAPYVYSSAGQAKKQAEDRQKTGKARGQRYS